MTLLQLTRPLVVLDTETTGEHPDKDRIVQIAVIKLYPDGQVNEWETLINPQIAIPPEITEVHGISDEDVRHAPFFIDIAKVLSLGIEGCDVCGYSVDFDLRFLKREFERARMVVPVWGHVLDPKRIFHLLYARNLTAAVEEFIGKQEALEFQTVAHDALEDTRMALRVLEAQLAREDWLPRTPEGLAAWTKERDLRSNRFDPAGKLAWRHGELVINFGNKELLTPVHRAERGYLKWMLNGDFSDEVKAVVRDALAGLPMPRRAPPAASPDAHVCPGPPGAGPCPKCSPGGAGEPR